jgi:hypothetical protein
MENRDDPSVSKSTSGNSSAAGATLIENKFVCPLFPLFSRLFPSQDGFVRFSFDLSTLFHRELTK